MPTLTGTYLYGDGTPRVGRVKFTASTTVVGAASIILPAPLEVDLDAAGSFSVDLVSTSDPAYSPSGWLWTITESMRGGRDPWSFEFTANADVADLSPVAVPDAYSSYVEIGDELTASLTSGAATAGQVPAADGAGGIDWADQSGSGGGYDVILLAGQSNMTGESSTYSLATDPVVPGVYQLTRAGAIEPATEPLEHPAATNELGPGLPFARWYVAAGLNAGRPVLLVPQAVNSSPLVDATAPTWNPATSGSLYDDAVTRANAAIAALTGSRLAAILWAQGEQDIDDVVPAATYETALDALIAAFRADITDATDAPFIIGGLIPELVAVSSGYAAYNAVQKDTPNRVLLTGWASPPVGYYDGGLHYLSDGYREMGRRYLDAYLAATTGLGSSVRWGGRVLTEPTITVTMDGLEASAAFDGVDYDGNPGTAYTIMWGDGNETTDATSPATHTYASAGTYTVTLAVADGNRSSWGGVTDTATATSAAALEATYVSSAASTDNLTSYTFAGLSLGAAAVDRTIVLHVGAYNFNSSGLTIASATVGGVAVTVDHEARTNFGTFLAVGRVEVPTGETGDVVVNFTASGACDGAAVGLYRIVGSAVAESDFDVAVAGSTATVTGVADGVVIAAGYAEALTGLTWTGDVAENYEVNCTASQKLGGASTTATGTVVSTISSSTKPQTIAVAYGPA